MIFYVVAFIGFFCCGVLHAYLLGCMHQNIFGHTSATTSLQRIRYLGNGLLRCGIIGVITWYLLRSSHNDSILVIMSFITGFWLYIIHKKARFYYG